MSHFKAKMHQIQLTALPQTSKLNLRGPTFEGRGGQERENERERRRGEEKRKKERKRKGGGKREEGRKSGPPRI